MNRTILLVEDNENNRYLAKFLLEREGFTVAVAVNGKEALAYVKQAVPDLILMDIQMPEMDGYETAVRLKQDPRASKVPIIGVSSFAMMGDREKAMNLGFAAYIEKPINPLTFVEQVKKFLPEANPQL